METQADAFAAEFLAPAEAIGDLEDLAAAVRLSPSTVELIGASGEFLFGPMTDHVARVIDIAGVSDLLGSHSGLTLYPTHIPRLIGRRKGA